MVNERRTENNGGARGIPEAAGVAAVRTRIDLDANATTPLLPAAGEAMLSAYRDGGGNPSSAHASGRRARQLLEDARERIAGLLGALPEEVIFTSGATEANNLAIFGLIGRAGGVSPPRVPLHILASPVEHPCVVEPLHQLEAAGANVEWLPVSQEGIVPANSLRERLRPETRLVAVMLANHETGAIQPVREIASSLPSGVLMHTDAAQAAGKVPVHFHDLGVASLSASAHKFRGPQGVGFLLLKKGTPLPPRTFGGNQEHGRRPGTEPVALAVGMAVALEHEVRNFPGTAATRARLWERLHTLASPVVLNGPAIGSLEALPTTLNVSFPGCRGDLLLMALDLAGVACSTGSACSSGSLLPSSVLKAMGVPEDVLRSALRFSFGHEIDLAMIDVAAERIAEVVQRLRGM